jgi:5-methylcytosine-specific restriction endonuclease McrA
MIHALRKPCACGSTQGSITSRSGQDCVFCCECNKFQYNAPKTETGRAVRTVKTTHDAISPKMRSKIIERANRRCERCGRLGEDSTSGLHVGHVVSVDAGHKYGLSDAEINGEDNLIAECAECNLGHGSEALPVRLLVALVMARTKRSSGHVS